MVGGIRVVRIAGLHGTVVVRVMVSENAGFEFQSTVDEVPHRRPVEFNIVTERTGFDKSLDCLGSLIGGELTQSFVSSVIRVHTPESYS